MDLVEAGTLAYEWWEFSPFEIAPLKPLSQPHASAAQATTKAGVVSIGEACPSWAFGRRFVNGVSVDVTAGGEGSIGLYMGLFGAAFNATVNHVFDEIAPGLPQVAPLMHNATLSLYTRTII